MKNIKLSKRYAKALFDMAKEQEIQEQVATDMQLINHTMTASNELNSAIQSPIIKDEKKTAVLKAVFSSHIQAVTLSFLNILTSKNREIFLDEISRQFILMYQEEKGIKTAYVKSPIRINKTTKEKLIAIVEKATGKQVELIEKIDDSLFGGFVLRFDGKEYDASINAQLENIKKKLVV